MMQRPSAETQNGSVSAVRANGVERTPLDLGELASLDACTGRQVQTVHGGGARDAAALVDTAAETFGSWRSMAPTERAAVLRQIAHEFRSAADGELPKVISQESGKRLVEARGELVFSAQYFDLYARLAEDTSQPWWPSPGRGHVVRRQPIGVAAVLTPWNFPASIPARKIAPALAAGCTVVWKPSEITVASSSLVAELIDAVVPPGVLGMVCGNAEAICNAWLDDERVPVLSFTGSTRVGRVIAERAARTLTRTVLELGGQAPFVVLDDAKIEAAVACLSVAKFRNNGQSCIAANRVWAPRGMLDDVTGAFEKVLKDLRVGDPLDGDTDLGPLALPTDPTRLAALVEDAGMNGASIVRGSGPEGGHFFPPAMCVAPSNEARLLNEEIFGPVIPFSPYDDLQEMVESTNALPNGLSGYVCTADRARGLDVAERLGLGIVGVNTATPNLVDAPFGGRKASGWGFEGGSAGMELFLATQTIAFQEQQ